MRRVRCIAGIAAGGLFALVAGGAVWNRAAAQSEQTVPFAETQAGMNRQASKDFENADKAMNAAYKKLLPTLDANRQKKLKAAQRAWLIYRDADAAFVASEAEGGSMQPMVYSGALTERTIARTKQLQGYGFAKSGISSE